MLLASKQHTVGDTRLWTVSYDGWLDENAAVTSVTVNSDSLSCTVGTTTILGPEVQFKLIGGALNERFIVTLAMTDNVGNIKHDTIAFTVVAA